MKFGLACEGVTDHIAIENILCGYFKDLEGDEITHLQPQLDETSENQLNFGGWEKLLEYLQSMYFREIVLNTDFIIIQLDSDISEHENFGVSHCGEIEIVIENIKNRLISIINAEESGFFTQYADKIIFAICVHSLECWLYAYHNKKPLNKPKITGCGKALNYLLNENGFSGEKDKRLYKKYSKFFQFGITVTFPNSPFP